MKTTLATWEDEPNHRLVQFSVEYAIDAGAVKIKSVIPQKVTFVCPHSNTMLRSIGVWTDAGRRQLADIFRASDCYHQLLLAVASPNGDASIPHMSIRQEVCFG